MRLHDCWDQGFEYRWANGSSSVVLVVCDHSCRGVLPGICVCVCMCVCACVCVCVCVCLCDLETSTMRPPSLRFGCCALWKIYFGNVVTVKFTAARLLRLWVRIPPGAWMSVCCECRVLSGRGLCDEPITRPEESYRLWCDLETSWMRRPWPTGRCWAK